MTLLATATPALRRRGLAAALLIGCLAPIALSGGRAQAATSSTPEVQALTLARAEYREAVRTVEFVGAHSDRLATSARLATAEAERLREAVEKADHGGVGSVVGRLFGKDESLTDQAAEMADNAAQVNALAAKSRRALEQAILASERARIAYDKVLAKQAHRQKTWSAEDSTEFAVSLAQPVEQYHVNDQEQGDRDGDALSRWETYLGKLKAEGIVPPPARRLADPSRLPKGQVSVTRRGKAVAGTSTVKGRDGSSLKVLPAETVRAVSTAFGRLGLPGGAPLGTSADFACGGLVADAWSATDQLPADSVTQWRTLATVPRSTMQMGDIVVFGDKRKGLEESAIYVGGGQVIVADPLTGMASVQPLDRARVYGVKRVGVPAGRTADAPPAGLCGTTPPVPGTGATTAYELQIPLAAGSYRISAGFGESGAMWAANHSGQDLAAPIGTTVAAVADGVVTVEDRGWAGRLVRIDHGGGVETWYAHMSAVDVTSGQRVVKGQKIGAVGNEGNSNGPHLHLEVRLDGVAVDPALVLRIPEIPHTDYTQGEIPAGALCSVSAASTDLLTCEAAVSFRMMSGAFAAELGSELCVSDAYPPIDDQATTSPTAETTATSVRGLGRAVDLCGGVERFDTAEHNWMESHGAAYGWTRPAWAAAGGSRPEPWHFEFQAKDPGPHES